jgi:hypothetical protein
MEHGPVGVQIRNSTHSYPWHQVHVRGQIHGPVTLLPRKKPTVPVAREASWAADLSIVTYRSTRSFWELDSGHPELTELS